MQIFVYTYPVMQYTMYRQPNSVTKYILNKIQHEMSVNHLCPFHNISKDVTFNIVTNISIATIYSLRNIYLSSLKFARQIIRCAMCERQTYRPTDIPIKGHVSSNMILHLLKGGINSSSQKYIALPFVWFLH